MQEIKFQTKKTYASRENADKAAKAIYGNFTLRYFIMPLETGRFIPVFVGQEAAQMGVFNHFTVIG